jgi:hypothetical protein
VKGLVKSMYFDKNVKRERRGSDTNYDSWNRTKKRLFADESNRRRKKNACINCGKVGHMFNDYSDTQPLTP